MVALVYQWKNVVTVNHNALEQKTRRDAHHLVTKVATELSAIALIYASRLNGSVTATTTAETSRMKHIAEA